MVVNEEMIKAILATIDEAIHVVDEKGVTIYYNQVAAKNDGLSVDEVIGEHILTVFPSLTFESSTLLRVLKTKEPIYNVSQTFRNMKGQLIDTINTTLPIFVAEKLVGAIEVAKDYKEIKSLSAKLADMQAKIIKKSPKPIEVKGARYSLDDIITHDERLIQVINEAKRVANSSSTVLVYGETGTGKELLVQGIHNASSRCLAPFIAQNCAALPETLLESLLFGTVKGSYTGAVDRPGLFELSHGGTLFLDELNSMPLELQSRLLRVLEDGVVRRIGSSKTYRVDVRVIVALNKRPEACLQDHELRPDLYYRLQVFSLEIPPLRERVEDIHALVRHFVNYFNEKFEKRVYEIEEKVFQALRKHLWPGNVRELKHIIEHGMNMVDGQTLKVSHLPLRLLKQERPMLESHPPSKFMIKPLREALNDTEDRLITSALETTQGNINQAANLLQIPRQTLQYKLQKKKYLKS